MKNTICLLIVLFYNSCFSQNIDLNQGDILENEYYSEINFEYINGKIIIPVIIENVTYKFLLDTGAPNCITNNLYNKIKPKLLSNIEVSDANSNTSKMDIVSILRLNIGNVTFDNSVALVLKEEKNLVFDCFKIDGFIGSNLLRNSIIQIDLKNKILKITNKISNLRYNKNNSTKVTLIGNQSSPFIWIRLRGKDSAKEQVLFDTGMYGLYDLSKRNYDILKKEKIYNIIAKGNGTKDIGMFGNSDEMLQIRLLIPEIKFGNATFKNIVTETTNDKNSRMGSAILDYGLVTLDYKNKDLYFDAFEKEVDLNDKILGFSPTLLNNKFVVGIVWDEELKEIIKMGDEILNVNGKNFDNIDLCELIINKSIFKKDEKFEISIKNEKGEIKQLVVEKKLPIIAVKNKLK